MEALPFVNRNKELTFLKADIGRNHIGSKVLFLSAPTGYGKSRVAEKIVRYVHNEEPKYLAIKLAISKSRSILEKDGFYIRMLGKELDCYAKTHHHIPTFKEFYKKNLSNYLKNTLAKKIIVGLLKKKVLTASAVDTLDRIFGTKDLKETDFFSADIPEIALSVAEYLNHIGKSNSIFLNVENIQNIDAISLDFLKNLVTISQQNYFLMEYTEGTDCFWSIEDLVKEFTSVASAVDIKPLLHLSVDDILKLFHNKPDALEAFIRNTYLNWDGNLRNIVDLNIKLQSDWNSFEISLDDEPDINSFSFESLNSLSANEKIVLALLAVHGGSVEVELAARVLHIGLQNSYIPVDEILRRLSSGNYIKFDSPNAAKLDHDSLGNIIINSEGYARELVLVISAWKHLYKKISKKGGEFFITKAEAAYYLIYLSALEGNPFEMIKCLEEMVLYVNNSLAPTRIIKQFNKIRDKIHSCVDNSILQKLELRMVEILSNLAMPDEAFLVLEGLPHGLPEVILYKGVLLEDMGKARDALKHVRHFLEHDFCVKSKRFKLALKLVEFACLRSLNCYKECSDIFYELLQNDNYHGFLEYGYVLRGANCILPASESISYIYKSISFFNSHSARIQEAHSRIELSVALAYAGEFELASSELEQSQSLLNDKIADRHTVLSNKACLLLLSKRDAQTALSLLRTAAITARGAFDRLAIHINTLIALSILGETNEAESLIKVIKQICDSDCPSDREIRKIAYRNIGLHYDSIGELVYAAQAKEKGVLIHEDIIKEGASQFKLPFEKEKEIWLTINNLSYCPCFLAHWHMEIGGSYDISKSAS